MSDFLRQLSGRPAGLELFAESRSDWGGDLRGTHCGVSFGRGGVRLLPPSATSSPDHQRAPGPVLERIIVVAEQAGLDALQAQTALVPYLTSLGDGLDLAIGGLVARFILPPRAQRVFPEFQPAAWRPFAVLGLTFACASLGAQEKALSAANTPYHRTPNGHLYVTPEVAALFVTFHEAASRR
jgi:hypothetical protein